MPLLRIFLFVGTTINFSSYSSRILVIALFLTCVLVYTFYTSFLISALTVNKIMLPFRSLQEMYAKQSYTFGFNGGGSLEDYFKARATSMIICMYLCIIHLWNWTQPHTWKLTQTQKCLSFVTYRGFSRDPKYINPFLSHLSDIINLPTPIPFPLAMAELDFSTLRQDLARDGCPESYEPTSSSDRLGPGAEQAPHLHD